MKIAYCRDMLALLQCHSHNKYAEAFMLARTGERQNEVGATTIYRKDSRYVILYYTFNESLEKSTYTKLFLCNTEFLFS